MRARTASLLAVCCLAAAACHKSNRVSSEARQRSENLTAAAVATMLSGNEDFAAMRGQLVEAVASDRNNMSARLFLGVATLLAAAQDQIQPDGELAQLLQRGGLVPIGTTGSLWDFRLQLEDHGQGLFKDSTPTLGEIQGWVHDTVRPALANLLTVLDAMPTNWEYVIPAANGGRLLQYLAPGQQIDLRLDHGDVQLVAAFGHAVQAGFDLLRVVDWDNLAPNALDPGDDPDRDLLDVIRTSYPNLGRLANVGDLAVARDRIRKAWQSYEKASAHLRAETAPQQAQGIFTIGRGTFGDEQQTQRFLAAEARVRAVVGPTIERFWQDQIVRFDTDVLTGNPLPLADQVEINFFRFFQGLDLRETYFRTIVDPFTGRRTMGVGALAELTTRMATFGDVLVRVGGQAPSPGDLQHLLYSVRVEAPPQSTKTIDGNFADWAIDSLLVVNPPSAWVQHPFPDLGSMHVSVDSDALYVWIDRDVLPALTAAEDRLEIVVDGPSGSIGLLYASGSGFQPISSYGLLPTFAHDATGLEIRFPLGPGAGQWARLERSLRVDNSAWSFDVDQQPVFVKVN